MGREIRMVPPHWDHPTDEKDGHFIPMYDKTFAQACQEWKEKFAAWERGERPDYFQTEKHPADLQFWEYDDGLPEDRNVYRPWQDEEATWVQLWETVSEGTPVSPPFETREELAAYLAENGDFWDQSRAAEGSMGFRRGDNPGWGKERAEAFVRSGWSPSMVIFQSGGHSEILESKDVPLHLEQAKAQKEKP